MDTTEIKIFKMNPKKFKNILLIGFVVIIVGMSIYQILGWKLLSLTCFNGG